MRKAKIILVLLFVFGAGILPSRAVDPARHAFTGYLSFLSQIRKGDTTAYSRYLGSDPMQGFADSVYTLQLHAELLWATGKDQAGLVKANQALLIAEQRLRRKGAGGYIKEAVASCYAGIGLYYYRKEKFVAALDPLNKAISLFPDSPDIDLLNDQLDEMHWAVSLIYSNLSNHTEALPHNHWLANMYMVRNDSLKFSSGLNLLGITHMNLAHFDSADYYFRKSLAIREKLRALPQVGQSYNNIGTMYFKQNRFSEALENYEKGYRLRVEGKASENAVTESMINIGKAQHRLNNIPAALEWLEKGSAAAKDRGELQRRALEDLKTIYFKKGDFRKAYAAQALFYEIRDSLFGLEMREDVLKLSYQQHVREDSITRAQSETMYRMEREQEAAMNTEKEKRAQVFGIALASGFLLLAIITGLLLRNNRRKKRDNETIGKQRDVLAEKQKEIGQSITYAGRIQEAMLPSAALLQKLAPDHFIFFNPRDVVSGDFYWATQQGDFLFVAVADCTGHGVPGALMSMIGINLLNQIVKEKQVYDPGMILLELHKNILKAFSEQQSEKTVNDGMDIALLRINRVNREACFAGAARPLLYRQDHVLHEIKGDRFSIGGVKNDDLPFSVTSLELRNTITFYLFSDGFSDQFGGEKGKKFMYKNLREKINGIGRLNLVQQCSELGNTFKHWKGDHPQVDDVTVIGIQVLV